MRNSRSASEHAALASWYWLHHGCGGHRAATFFQETNLDGCFAPRQRVASSSDTNATAARAQPLGSGTLLIRPIIPAPNSVNQILPSGPKVIPVGLAFAPAGEIRPISALPCSVNHEISHRSRRDARRLRAPLFKTYSAAMIPWGVILPILSAFFSVNRKFPSGPAAISKRTRSGVLQREQIDRVGASQR